MECFRLRRPLLWLAVLLVLGGCTSVARLSDFPMTNEGIDFRSPSAKTEYGLFTADMAVYEVPVRTVLDSARQALKSLGYTVRKASLEDGVVAGERGMTWTEWKTVAVIYFKDMDGGIRIKIACKITKGYNQNFKNSHARDLSVKLNELITARR